MLKIQEFISCFDKIDEANEYLKRNLNISHTVHTLDGDYSVILYEPGRRADMTNPIVRETHRLVLDETGSLVAKAWDYPKIADDVNEFPAEFSFGSPNIVEELPDGEMVIVYNIEGKWVIGTKDTTNGIEGFPNSASRGFTHARQVKELLTGRFERWDHPFANSNPYMCFVFTYVNPHNSSCITPAVTSDLYLMGVINLETGREFNTEMVDVLADKMGFAHLHRGEIYGLSSLSHKLRNMHTLSPGLMLRDKRNNRVIISNPIYTTVKNAQSAGERIQPIHIAKILNACRDEKDMADITASFQDYGPMLELMWVVRQNLHYELKMLWDMAKAKRRSMAEFTEIVHYHPLNYILYMLLSGAAASVTEQINALKPHKLVELTKMRERKEFEAASRLMKFAGGSTNEDEEGEGSLPYCREGD